jgi:hypothetical protein
MKSVVTQYGPKDIFKLDRRHFFIICKEDSGIKGREMPGKGREEKRREGKGREGKGREGKGREEHKEIVAVFYVSMLMAAIHFIH